MIEAKLGDAFDALVARLAARAAALARARAQSDQLARQRDPRRWRQSGLIWPLFAKG